MPSSSVRVGVVFGGASGEHAVSIRSASTVITALRSAANRERFEVTPFYIDLEGRWWPEAVAEAVLASGQAAENSDLPDPLPPQGFGGLPSGAASIDVWYPVLHGPNGEDGTVQGLFTLMGKPFVGAGVLGSAVGMDKLLERIETELGYPCFVKPANLGSSVGISKARTRQELNEGLDLAAELDQRIVVEKGVKARELECAVIGVKTLEASVVGEIRFDADWYDYTTKYSDGLSHTLIPAPIASHHSDQVRQMALAACRALCVSGMARVDFFYDDHQDQLWINEINTLPGFTSLSMYPMLWNASGLPLETLVARLVENARE
jgi:D-alanine-D-alanine ligase